MVLAVPLPVLVPLDLVVSATEYVRFDGGGDWTVAVAVFNGEEALLLVEVGAADIDAIWDCSCWVLLLLLG